MNDTIRVVRRAIHRDEVFDLTSRVIGVKPFGSVSSIAIHEKPQVAEYLEAPLTTQLGYKKVDVQFSKLAMDKRCEEVVKTEQWGDKTVEFIDEWMETYWTMAPSDIRVN